MKLTLQHAAVGPCSKTGLAQTSRLGDNLCYIQYSGTYRLTDTFNSINNQKTSFRSYPQQKQMLYFNVI